MGFIARSLSATFTNALQPGTFNPDRTGLVFENIAGFSKAFTEKNLAGTGDGISGEAAMSTNFATYGAVANAFDTQQADPSNITFCGVESIVDNSAYLLVPQVAGSDRLMTCETGGNVGVFLAGVQRAGVSRATHSANVPYFMAFTHTAAGALTVYLGKAGVLASNTFAGAAYTASASTSKLKYGGGPSGRTGTFRNYYGALYNVAKTSSQIDTIYRAARDYWLTVNADF